MKDTHFQKVVHGKDGHNCTPNSFHKDGEKILVLHLLMGCHYCNEYENDFDGDVPKGKKRTVRGKCEALAVSSMFCCSPLLFWSQGNFAMDKYGALKFVQWVEEGTELYLSSASASDCRKIVPKVWENCKSPKRELPTRRQRGAVTNERSGFVEGGY